MLRDNAIDDRIGRAIELLRRKSAWRPKQLLDGDTQPSGQLVQRFGLRMARAADQRADCPLIEATRRDDLVERQAIAVHEPAQVDGHLRGFRVLSIKRQRRSPRRLATQEYYT